VLEEFESGDYYNHGFLMVGCSYLYFHKQESRFLDLSWNLTSVTEFLLMNLHCVIQSCHEAIYKQPPRPRKMPTSLSVTR
jgi:hypothetical protein